MANYSLKYEAGKRYRALNKRILLEKVFYVTTATKTLEGIKKSGAAVSLITAEELRNMGISSVEVRAVKTDFFVADFFTLDAQAHIKYSRRNKAQHYPSVGIHFVNRQPTRRFMRFHSAVAWQ